MQFLTKNFVYYLFYKNSCFDGTFKISNIAYDSKEENNGTGLIDVSILLDETNDVKNFFNDGAASYSGFCYFNYLTIKVGDNVVNQPVYSDRVITKKVAEENPNDKKAQETAKEAEKKAEEATAEAAAE